jgi:hypothetical protein
MIGFLNFPEKYAISVRATDGKGITQPEKAPQIGSGVGGQLRLAVEVPVTGLTSGRPGTPRSSL